MIEKVGKYEIRMRVDNYNMMTIVKRIWNTETKERFDGSLALINRKQYDKFFDDIKKDIIPPNFRKWKKPEDIISEEEMTRILDKNVPPAVTSRVKQIE